MTELACRSFQSFPTKEHPSERGSRIDMYPYEYRFTDLSFSGYFPFPCCYASACYFNHTFES